MTKYKRTSKRASVTRTRTESSRAPLVTPRHLRRIGRRFRYAPEFAWGIPSETALRIIKALGPILEVGAGGGYWAQLLRERGADVLAIDSEPDPALNRSIGRRWGLVIKGECTVAASHPDRTLLLVWPPMSQMARRALRSYGGDRLVYIGEPRGGCTASDGFFDLLESEWEPTQQVRIPSWRCFKDRMTVYRRRS